MKKQIALILLISLAGCQYRHSDKMDEIIFLYRLYMVRYNDEHRERMRVLDSLISAEEKRLEQK